MLHRLILVFSLSILGILWTACSQRPPIPSTISRMPNIVLMLADDLGYGDLGATDCPDIRTPHLDNLAREGVLFTQSYSNGAVCSPTRAALLTGQYQQRVGVDRVIYVNERDRGLTLDAVLLPELLHQAGYATAITGKWHLGIPLEYFPTRQGFDHFFGFVAGNVDYFQHTDRLGNHDLWLGETEISRNGEYMTDLIGEHAIEFIERNRERPFFLYVPFSAPHDPFQGPEHGATAGNREVTMNTHRTREVFRSMVESMDSAVGRIVEAIHEQGLDRETVIFFMSDNGGLPVVARNAPLRGFKRYLWEGGIRSPLIARWPGRFPAGTVRPERVAGMDLFPTVLELAGVAIPEGHRIDSVSLAGLLDGTGELDRDTLFFHYQDPSLQIQYAMIQRGWKYLRDSEGKEHLFDLDRDPSERSDLKSEEVDRFERMKQEYAAWREEVFQGAPYEPPPPFQREQ